LKDHSGAIEDYTKAISLDSNYVRAYFNRGNSYMHLGNYASAILDFNKAISLEPGFTEAHVNREIAVKRQQDLAND
jgi:tetratricopeptide (TPR) repeat protein